MKAYEYLVENHLTTDKKAFADSVGISSSLMTEIDKGRSSVGVNAIQNIVLKYNISSSWLLTGEGTMLKNDTVPPSEATVQPIYQPRSPEKRWKHKASTCMTSKLPLGYENYSTTDMLTSLIQLKYPTCLNAMGLYILLAIRCTRALDPAI